MRSAASLVQPAAVQPPLPLCTQVCEAAGMVMPGKAMKVWLVAVVRALSALSVNVSAPIIGCDLAASGLAGVTLVGGARDPGRGPGRITHLGVVVQRVETARAQEGELRGRRNGEVVVAGIGVDTRAVYCVATGGAAIREQVHHLSPRGGGISHRVEPGLAVGVPARPGAVVPPERAVVGVEHQLGVHRARIIQAEDHVGLGQHRCFQRQFGNVGGI